MENQQLPFDETPADPDDQQGLGTFLQYSRAPQDRNLASEYFGAGLVYFGPLHGRDAFVFGLRVILIL